MNALFVFLGGGTGSVLRYLVGLWIGASLGRPLHANGGRRFLLREDGKFGMMFMFDYRAILVRQKEISKGIMK